MSDRRAYDDWKGDAPGQDDHWGAYRSLEPYEVQLPGGGVLATVMASCEASAVVLAERGAGIGRRWLRAEKATKNRF